jgi:hypothetical protein
LAVIINICHTKEARKLGENADGQVPAHEAINRMPLSFKAIIAALVLHDEHWLRDVHDMDSKLLVTDSQSTCIIDFQKNSCNPLNLTEPCEKILGYVQKDGR